VPPYSSWNVGGEESRNSEQASAQGAPGWRLQRGDHPWLILGTHLIKAHELWGSCAEPEEPLITEWAPTSCRERSASLWCALSRC